MPKKETLIYKNGDEYFGELKKGKPMEKESLFMIMVKNILGNLNKVSRTEKAFLRN